MSEAGVVHAKEKKDVAKISILTVNYNTSDFIDVMLYSFSKLTLSPYKVVICDNGSEDKHLVALSKAAQKYENVEVIFRRQSTAGSIGHGEAMDILVSKVDTPYFVTMDPDAVFLLKNWDQHLIKRLNEKVKAIGTQAPGDKPKDFPLMFAVLYETKTFRQLNPSFLPDVNGMKLGQLTDTGWLIRNMYIENGYKGEVLEYRSTRKYKNGPFCDIYAIAEFYLTPESNITASHFGRGSTSGLPKYNSMIKHFPRIGLLIGRILAGKERKRWIIRVRELIDKVA